MIPKIIHYCWFGGNPIPAKEIACMATWQRMLPGYIIKRWDEDTFDVNSTTFTKEAYRLKKYAFVADYVRLYALTKFGGLYLDTDVEIVKPFDDLLEKHSCFGGFETSTMLQTGVLACEPNNEIFEQFFQYYKTHNFVWGGEDATLPNSAILRDVMTRRGLVLNNEYQCVDGFASYPMDYFCPIDQGSRQVTVTDNTYCIHYLMGSWFPASIRFKNTLKMSVGKYLGYGFVNKIRHLIGKS